MTVDRPFVDRRVEDLDRAGRVAAAAARRWDLPEPSLLRRGMNGIYECGHVVVRVGRATAPAATSHQLAEVMVDQGVAVARPVAGAAADIDGFGVTAWERIVTVDAPIDWRTVGVSVARIHRLDPGTLPGGYPVPSPTGFPWWDFDAMLASVAGHVDDAALTGIRTAIDEGRWWVDGIEHDAVVCHGDVHPGNVLMSADGPVLIDFDLLCRAAPAWDHAMLTTYAERWGGDPGVYASFAEGYGRCFVDDDLATTVASLRNVAATLMRIRAGITDDDARVEAERRLRYWRGDAAAPQWRAQ